MKLEHKDADVTMKLTRVERTYTVELISHADNDEVLKRHVISKRVDALRMYLHMIVCEATCYADSDEEQEAILALVK